MLLNSRGGVPSARGGGDAMQDCSMRKKEVGVVHPALRQCDTVVGRGFDIEKRCLRGVLIQIQYQVLFNEERKIERLG